MDRSSYSKRIKKLLRKLWPTSSNGNRKKDNTPMDLLEKCESLLAEIKQCSEDFSAIDKRYTDDLDIDEAQELYEMEFINAIKMAGAYEDLVMYLSKLQDQNPEMQFVANGMLKTANKLVTHEVIDVSQ